jgi:hypothetical protein
MADDTELQLKITGGPPFWWEIYRGDDPQWVERSMFGYLIEKEALIDGQAALRSDQSGSASEVGQPDVLTRPPNIRGAISRFIC